jgi:hypothetical protein
VRRTVCVTLRAHSSRVDVLLTPMWQAPTDGSKLQGCAVTDSLFDLHELAAASRTVARVMAPTPQLCWPLLCEAVGTEV